MKNLLLQLSTCVFIAGNLFPAALNTPNLTSQSKPAVAWSSGALKINGTDHVGTGNVFPGNEVETLRASGHVYFADGSRLRLGAETRVQVSASTLNLNSGVARVDAVAAGQAVLPIRAGDLNISGLDGVVSRPNPNDILVSAFTSSVAVRLQDGLLIAMVQPGETRNFAMGKASARVKTGEVTGTVKQEAGKYYVTDELSHVRVQLQGGKPSRWKNKRVRAKGDMSKSTSGDAILHVKEVSLANAGAVAGAAGGAAGAGSAAGTAAGAAAGTVAAGTGLSTAVISGIVVTTAAVAGTSLALVNNPEDNPISR